MVSKKPDKHEFIEKSLPMQPAAPTVVNLDREELTKKGRSYLQLGDEVEDTFNKMMTLELTRRHLAATVPVAQRDEFLTLIQDLRSRQGENPKENG